MDVSARPLFFVGQEVNDQRLVVDSCDGPGKFILCALFQTQTLLSPLGSISTEGVLCCAPNTGPG